MQRTTLPDSNRGGPPTPRCLTPEPGFFSTSLSIHSLIGSLIHLPIHSFIYPVSHSLTHSSPIHSFIHSFLWRHLFWACHAIGLNSQ
jgi:hypothetical protein